MEKSKWRKAKLSLGLNLCVYDPKTLDDDDDSSSSSRPPIKSQPSDFTTRMPTTPTPSSSGLTLSKSSNDSSKNTCSICMGTMKPGQGQALFTAECSHTFHFHCITTNVKHGNHNCPVCRTTWNQVPFFKPSSLNEPHMNILRRLPRSVSSSQTPQNQYHHHLQPIFRDLDLSEFNDDEPLEICAENKSESQISGSKHVELKTFTELSEIRHSDSKENFYVLIHLKAPNFDKFVNSRAPVDLITLLDVSGSMVGSKLALLKRAMGFVIQNLCPSDRLSVISFSSTAKRLFPLRRMTELGKKKSVEQINLLVSNGGTNISEGLRKGIRVLEERRERNPVCSIVLLSDGQDTYTVTPTSNLNPNFCQLLPTSFKNNTCVKSIPVHVFGFGTDHDSVSLHSISEASGGTFSFIETEDSIQDAFAQCIGGLLSVVAQELHVKLDICDSRLNFGYIKSGNYVNSVSDDKKKGSIDVGYLYAEEERDFLVSVNIPPEEYEETETKLFNVHCAYANPLTKEKIVMDKVHVKIPRPLEDNISHNVKSIEVDRQKNRFDASKAMSESQISAELGDLSKAISILERSRKNILESFSGKSNDPLCISLDNEMREMQERMRNREKYEVSGRAYVLSGLSAHSSQRATARGDFSGTYQTSFMVDMVERSRTMSPLSKMRQVKSFPARIEPR